MKMPAFLFEKSISLWKKIRLWDSTHRSALAGVPSNRGDVKEISFENLQEIFEYDNSESIREELRLENEYERNQDFETDKSRPKSNANHPKNRVTFKPASISTGEHIYTSERSYIKHIREKACKYGIEDHILIKELSNGMPMRIGELTYRFHVKYKITIQNLTIKVGETNFLLIVHFDKVKDDMKGKASNLTLTNKGGMFFVFKGNSFVLSSPDTIHNHISWSLGEKRHLIFERNEFISINMGISTEGRSTLFLNDNYFNDTSSNSFSNEISIRGESVRVVLAGNYFDNITLGIEGNPDGRSGHLTIDNFWTFSSDKKNLARRMEKRVNRHPIHIDKDVIYFDNKVKEEEKKSTIKDILKMLLYMDEKITVTPDDLERHGESVVHLEDNSFSTLKIVSHECYFGGENIINNLEMNEDLRYLYWEPYQNIDSGCKHAHDHKQMFIKLIERAVQNNDKILEAKLRRELLKCEKVLISKEKNLRSIQDRIILGWSSLISDYGISWLRPFLWLAFINALLTAIILIVKFFNPECLPDFSYDEWWFLFAKLFSPLSNLSDLTGVENSGWITFINVAQKAILAAAYYEMIKIFRRFSK